MDPDHAQCGMLQGRRHRARTTFEHWRGNGLNGHAAWSVVKGTVKSLSDRSVRCGGDPTLTPARLDRPRLPAVRRCMPHVLLVPRSESHERTWPGPCDTSCHVGAPCAADLIEDGRVCTLHLAVEPLIGRDCMLDAAGPVHPEPQVGERPRRCARDQNPPLLIFALT